MDETKIEDTKVEETAINESDFAKYEKNILGEDNDSNESKMKELLDKQDATITQLRSEIKTLKELNMQLALHGNKSEQPLNAVDALNAAFNTAKV